jgi:hypothetical protein
LEIGLCNLTLILSTSGNPVEFERFADFVTTLPLEGLGTDKETLIAICEARGDKEAKTLLVQALANRRGPPLGNKNQLGTNGLVQTISTSPKKRDRPGKVILSLRKDYPGLYQEVIAGQKSETEAAIEAGIVPPRIKINTASADSAATAIKKYCSQQFISELVALLGED